MTKDATYKRGTGMQRSGNDEGEPLTGLIDGARSAGEPSLSSPRAEKGSSPRADDETGAAALARLFSQFGTAKAAAAPYQWREAPGVETNRQALLAGSPRCVAWVARSGCGKSFGCEYVAEQALDAKMNVVLADFDRDNASLTARFGASNVVRPLNADDSFFAEGIKKLHGFQKEYGCDVLLDVGFGSVRTFCSIAKAIRLQAIQEANGIRPVLVIPLGLNLDDLMVLEKLDGAYLPRDILLMLNAGLVPAGKDISLEFEPVLRDPRILGLFQRGARSMVMPAMPSGGAFHNTKKPFSWAAKMDWANPLNEFEQAGASEFLRDMRKACETHSDILPFPRPLVERPANR